MYPKGALLENTSALGHIGLLQQVVDLLPHAIFIKDRDGCFIEGNKKFCKLFGHAREDFIGKSDFEFFSAEQALIYQESDLLVFKLKQDNVNVGESHDAKGNAQWLKSVKSYYQDESGQEYIIGVLTDLTEIKANETKLIEAEKQAIAGAKSKASFLANMSHEIRTPMNGVIGMSDVLKNTDLDAQQNEIVNTLQRSGKALMQIIDDVLDYSKLEAGQMTLYEDIFYLRDMVDDVMALLGVSARDKGLDLILSYDSELPQTVNGDAGRLRQVLTNLIGNAIKFTTEGFVSLSVTGNIEDGKATLSFSVKDTGIGIADNKIDKIFEEFQQADKTTTHNFGGTGLGLAISQSLVEAMGGDIQAQSVVGEGTHFFFDISLSLLNDEIEDILEPRKNEVVNINKRHKILMVDDIQLNHTIVQSQLSPYGVHVDYVKSARSAIIELVKAKQSGRPYTILLTDYQMPDVDGLKLVASLRRKSEFSDMNVVVMSSVNDASVRKEFLTHEKTQYLVKPVKKVDLENSIASMALS